MKLQVVNVRDRGDASRERIVLKAGEEVDIGDFLILKARRSKEGVQSGDVPRAFWFEDKIVPKGALVVLYTKAGASSEKKNDSGISYFYYWGLESPIWTNSVMPVLIHSNEWGFVEREG